MRTGHVNSSATSPHHPYFFFIWNYKNYHIWQFLVFIPVTGFQCHSVPANSGDCSSEITGISKFRGRSEILAGKFHWNDTGIRRNDRNPAGICGASLRPLVVVHTLWLVVVCGRLWWWLWPVGDGGGWWRLLVTGGVCVLGVGRGCHLLHIRCFMVIVAICGHLCSWVSLFVVVMGSDRHSQCGRSSSVVVCLDGGGKEKRNASCCQTNIVCYPWQINNKQINHSSGMPFLPIPGNIPV